MKEIKATRTVELAKGAYLTIEAVYHYDHEDGDAMADKATFHEEYTKVIYTFTVNGKVFKNGYRRVSVAKDTPYEIMFKDTKVGLRQETAEKVLEAEAEAIAEVEPVEFAKAKAEEKEIEMMAEKKEIEAKVKEIESSNLFETEAEARAERKRLNDLYNEGGEGFLPKVYSVEYLNSLKRRLEELS